MRCGIRFESGHGERRTHVGASSPPAGERVLMRRREVFLPVVRATGLICTLAVLLPAPAASQEDFSIAPPAGWIRPVEDPGISPSGSPDPVFGDEEVKDTELLLVSLQDRVSPGQVESYVRLRYRVRGAGSLQEDSQVEIGFDPVYQELILHSATVERDGVEIEQLLGDRVRIYDQEPQLAANIVDGRKSAVLFLEDVRVGDVIDYSYTVRGSNPVFGGHYGREFPLGTSSSVGLLHVRLRWERENAPRLRSHRIDAEPKIRSTGAATEYEWRLENTEARLVEPNTPAWYRVHPTVDVSDFRSWAEVAEWGRELFQTTAPLPEELVRRVETIEDEHPQPEDRLAAALRFAQDEIRYLSLTIGENSHRPYPPSTVLERRYGDCKDKSLLLIAMLDAMGIEAHPALVNTRRGKHLEGELPSAGAFDHAIVRVQIEDRHYWVDPTRVLDREPLEPHRSPYGAALVLAPGTTSLTRLDPPDPTRPERDIRARLDIGPVDGKTEMTVETVYRRGSATAVRQRFETTSRAEIARKYLEFYSELYPGVESAGAVEMTDDQTRNEIVVTERYSIPDFWYDPEGDSDLVGELYPLEIAYELHNTGSGLRSMPLAVDHPVWIRYAIEARSGDGWAIDPEEGTVSTDVARLTYRTEVDDAVLLLTYEYKTLDDHVEPESAAEHLRGVERMSNLLGFSITPPGGIMGAFGGTLGLRWAVLVLALLIAGAHVVGIRRTSSRGLHTVSHPPDDPQGVP